MGLLSWLGLIGFGAAGIKDAYDTCSVYDSNREKAKAEGQDVFYGRRGEMYDVVTGKKCRIKKYSDGSASLVELTSDKFIRSLSGPKEKTQQELALEKGCLGYITTFYGHGRPQVCREASTGRIYEVNYKVSKSAIYYQKIVDGRLFPDGSRSIPKEAFNYYKWPEDVCPPEIMEKVIKYEEKNGIFRKKDDLTMKE